MSWIMAGMAAAGVLQGLKNEKKAEQAKKERAEMIRYSPWSGMSDPGPVEEGAGAMEMGLQGAFMGSQIKGKPGSTPSPGGGTTTGANNVLGGQDMSNALAQQYGQESMGFDFKPRYLSMK
jgi:hypothetical protein